MTTRRQILTFAAGALALPVRALGQARKVPRVAATYTEGLSMRDAFRQGLQERGWIEGKNIIVEYRLFQGRADGMPAVAAEIVGLNVDVIVASSNPMISALKNATQTIPIVMANVGDPVGSGFIASLARPGGNVTGLANLAEGMSAKRLEILMDIKPRISRVAILRNAAIPTHAIFYKEIESGARSAKVTLVPVDFRSADDFEDAFKTMSKERADALIVLPDPVSAAGRVALVELAAKYKLATIYPFAQFVDAGGLAAYGANIADLWRRTAAYVDRILKGAKPADLPVEQPTKFDFVLNAKTAAALGITIPQSVLLRADRVIE